PVRPVVHYMMGGIHTNIETATPLSGLFAAGECACVSINGANRLGSNSLTELLVFGARAGRAAAAFAKAQAKMDTPALEAQAKDEQERIRKNFLTKMDGKERIAAIRSEMTAAMEAGAGIYREEATLKATCDKLAELKARFKNVTIDDRSNTYNTELTAVLELENMLDVAEAVAHSAWRRRESRGSHQRTDYPKRDDEKFLAHSLAYRTKDGPPRIDYLPVVITIYPPAERKYGDK
ncbi:MAG TPA: FAD-binding protein, partial [Methylomirabilota bacterium]|nr:FAD-binding protein [Methylomirabilota bacterium]